MGNQYHCPIGKGKSGESAGYRVYGVCMGNWGWENGRMETNTKRVVGGGWCVGQKAGNRESDPQADRQES